MKTERRDKHAILDYILIILGASVYAFAAAGFIRPINAPLGGISGIAQVISHLTGFPMGVLIIIMNLPLFIYGRKTLGNHFILRSLAAMLVSSLLIDLFSGRLPSMTANPLLSALYGGVLMGAGLGLVLSRGGTSGGSDIVAKLMHMRREHISIGKISLAINAAVIACAAAVFRSIESALFAILIQYASATVIDGILNGMDHAKCALIVTQNADAISDAINSSLRRGVTGLAGEGMYTKTERMVLMVAVRKHEIGVLKRLVQRLDGEAFVIMLNAGEVFGRGFKSAQ
ncbi:MAG: YitT family protein [Oscillospiraceae bacterium]|nr:YitT family protein [Oscillospiraceae bacterium]